MPALLLWVGAPLAAALGIKIVSDELESALPRLLLIAGVAYAGYLLVKRA